MKLLVCIPALNEDKSISKVISETKRFLPQAEILVIDDGSTDNTAIKAKNSGSKVISMPFNVGVGGAIRVAFKYAHKHEYSHVLQIDADGQHLPSEAKHLLSASSENCVVIGSRFLGKDKHYKISRSRRMAIGTLSKLTSLLCKKKLTDVTSGFRLSCGKAIELFANEYPTDYLGDTVESIIIANRNDLDIKEVSVQMRNRMFGSPSQNSMKSIWYLFRVTLIIILTLLKKPSSTDTHA